MIVPDHKVYFVPLKTESEAAYLTAFLNARVVSTAISAYAAALSLGTSVTDYLNIPKYNAQNPAMREMAGMAKKFKKGATPTEADEARLNELVISLLPLEDHK